MKSWQFIILIATILVAALLVGGVYDTKVVQTDGDKLPLVIIKVNRITGKSWFIHSYTNANMNCDFEQDPVK